MQFFTGHFECLLLCFIFFFLFFQYVYEASVFAHQDNTQFRRYLLFCEGGSFNGPRTDIGGHKADTLYRNYVANIALKKLFILQVHNT